MNTQNMSSTAPVSRRKATQSSFSDRIGSWWEGMAPRERKAVAFAAWVVGLALLWWVLLGPALTTLKSAPAQHASLDAQLSEMQTMAATATQLRSQTSAPTPSRNAALSAIEHATSQLGETAQITVQNDRATLMLRGTSPDGLAQWLGQVRVNARVVPISAQLNQRGSPAAWHGQITVTGPGLGANGR